MFYELQCWDVLTQEDVSLIGLATLILVGGPYPKTLAAWQRLVFYLLQLP
jgi:hypothetical protein